ncbi:MAG: DNA mismatch repair protein MutS [Flavobacteriaceae bacterium]|nr:DNA mismatch repair protein MutS [Flavobacteriaceae bacterium]
MNKPMQTYIEAIKKFELQLKHQKKKLLISSLIRLAVFLSLAYAIYSFWGEAKWVLGCIVVGIALFVFLVNRHTNLKHQKAKLQNLIALNQNEIKVLNRDFAHQETGKEYLDQTHEYAHDIDLFGERSFFQYLNRTSLKSAERKLAEILTSNNIQRIEEKQSAIQELAEKVEFRQSFSAEAQLVNTETSPEKVASSLLDYKAFVPKIMRWFPFVFSGLSVVVFILLFLDIIGLSQLLLWFVLGLAITGVFIGKTQKLSSFANQAQSIFQQYSNLVKHIENQHFSSVLLQEFQADVKTDNASSSQLMHQFSKRIDALEQRNNFLLGFVLNGFLLWDLQKSHPIEKWIKEHGNKYQRWIEVVHLFEAYNSLGNFAYNHPTYTYPQLQNEGNILSAQQAVHPLIDPATAVKNDVEIGPDNFLIITGANMAGKSTFLRTVALQIVMANVGFPVCASSVKYQPIQLITSMRTMDSLADEASYFFAELSRLKFIVERLKQSTYFIVLDEILKGTNSTDKANGSKDFLKKLLRYQSVGVIATHDLSLCEIAEDYPQVKNFYFDANIYNDELDFDYLMKPGICKNMNASFLLRKMGIVD